MMSMLFLDSLLHPDNGSSKLGLPWPLFLVPLEGFQQRELVVSFGRSGGRGRLLRGWQSEEFYSYKLQTSTDLRSWNSQYLSGGREITTSLQTVDHAVPVSYFRLLLPVLAPFDMKTVLHSVLVGAFRLLRGIYCVVLYPNPRERLPSLAPSLVFWHCSASPLLSMHWGGGIVPAIRCIRGFHDGRPLIPALSNRGTAPWFLHLCSLLPHPAPLTLIPAPCFLHWDGWAIRRILPASQPLRLYRQLNGLIPLPERSGQGSGTSWPSRV